MSIRAFIKQDYVCPGCHHLLAVAVVNFKTDSRFLECEYELCPVSGMLFERPSVELIEVDKEQVQPFTTKV
jgi:hypothetical protein